VSLASLRLPHFTREQAYEGKYIIQTEEPNLSAVEAVRFALMSRGFEVEAQGTHEGVEVIDDALV
jgi:hypothetical protein